LRAAPRAPCRLVLIALVSTDATGIILFSINFFPLSDCRPAGSPRVAGKTGGAAGTKWRNKPPLDVPAAGPRLISPITKKKKVRPETKKHIHSVNCHSAYLSRAI
jgi:hypothetical protein